MSADLLTISDVVALFNVSEATVKRDRKAGTVEAVQEDTGRRAWLYRRSSLEARYSTRDNVSEPNDDQDDDADAPNDHGAERRIRDLEHELTLERERRQAAEAIAHERLQRAENAELALRAITTAPAPPAGRRPLRHSSQWASRSDPQGRPFRPRSPDAASLAAHPISMRADQRNHTPRSERKSPRHNWRSCGPLPPVGVATHLRHCKTTPAQRVGPLNSPGFVEAQKIPGRSLGRWG